MLTNYTIVSGSTILTLNKNYLNELSLGKHTVKFVYEDGSVATDFNITKLAEKNTNNSNKKTVSYKAAGYSAGNPQTGDSIINYVIMLMISVSGLTALSKGIITKEQ